MHVLSTAQFREHLRLPEPSKLGRLLDIGAGDGGVTEQLAPLFDTVEVSEANLAMRLRLAMRGWKVHNLTSWLQPAEKYDVVACLNVLDRWGLKK
jgi:2-polyprenyl-3-methyl-5-hydroxy-6-metoxy-1,4-benzoquinol methylase